MTRRSLPFAVLAAAYLALIGLVTLGPTLWSTRWTQEGYDVLSSTTWLDPDTWVRLGSPEFTANILLFVPLGLLVRLAIPHATWVGAVVIGVTASVAIEVLQVWTPRVSDPRDLLANTVGALVGAVLGAVISAIAGRGNTGRGSKQPVLSRATSRPTASRAMSGQALSGQARAGRAPASRPQAG